MMVFAAALQGLNRATEKVDQAARRLAPGRAGWGADSVELSAEMVSLIEARRQFTANLGAIKTGDEMLRDALDLTG